MQLGRSVGADRSDRPCGSPVLATDRGSMPMNIGAVLEFDTAGGPSLSAVRALLSERCRRFPDCVGNCSAFGWVAAWCGWTIPTLCSTSTSSNGNGLRQVATGNCSTLRRS